MAFDYDFLKQPYQRETWKAFIRYVFPNENDLFAAPQTFPELHGERIKSFVQFGNIHLQDRFGSQLALFEVMLKPGSTKLQINRIALREIIEKLRRDTLVTGAFAVFADEKSGKWRFTFIAKQEIFGEKTIETADPRRFTYVFGKGETTLTAEQRFSFLAGKAGKQLGDVVEAFSVEKIGDEFFKKYKTHYEALCQHLYQKPEAAQIFKADTPAAAQKLMRDFAKKLMGRLVFLYFLQKKGWLGAATDADNWHSGDPNFIRNLFQKSLDRTRFHSSELARLFFKTLNERRPDDLFEMPDGSKTRVPYLNGGLFDPEDSGPEGNALDFDEKWFVDVFEFFGQYNFTIDENAPHDHEVGIDPEMLGHIFENLLEDNKDKGAFYTPKEIVHYMCHESLLEYLKTALGQPTGDDLAALETFVRDKKSGEFDNFIHRQAVKIKRALLDVRICDPAIGSGAFPMGLLHEIFHCQVELDPELDPAALKKNIIHHCIFGVDKDKGAVDIARLRFWLSLVVDDDEPQELPNLDFKIMQGDSLLERFEGIDLSRIAQTETSLQVRVVDLFSEQEAITEIKPDAETLVVLLDEYFAPDEAAQKHRKKPRPKAQIHAEIDQQVLRHIEYNLEAHDLQLTNRLADAKKELEKLVAAVQSPDQKQKLRTDSRAAQKVADLEAQTQLSNARFERLKTMQGREERPFFLWQLYFRDVFERGGFDIVIGNPPYIRQELLGKLKTDLALLYPNTFRGQADILVYFVELALMKLMKPGGQFAFIINNKWIRAGYGEGLRVMLQQKARLQKLLDFGDLPVFEDAMAYPCILLFSKNEPAETFDAVLFEDVPFKNQKDLTEEVKRLKFPAQVAELEKEHWHFNLPMEKALLQKINAQSVTLDEYIEGNTARGIVSGASNVFAVPSAEIEKLGILNEAEKKVIKPMLMGRDLKKYESPVADKQLFFIPWHFPMHEDESVTGASYEAEEKFKTGYPVIYDYLCKHKTVLENRNKAETGIRYEWYALQRWGPNHYKLFDQPKIMYQKFQVSPCFVLDENGLYCNDSMWIIPKADRFLLGYLNSRLGWWCITKYCSRISGGYQLMYEYLKNIPIPKVGEAEKQPIERLVNYILWQKKQPTSTSGQQRSDYLEQVLDGLVFELYFGEKMRAASRAVAAHLGELPPLATGQEEATVGAVFERLFEKTHPVRVNLFHLRSIEEIGGILDATGPKKEKNQNLTDHAPTDNED